MASRMTYPVLTRLVRWLFFSSTSCIAERTFCALRRLRTYLRSTMTQKRLTLEYLQRNKSSVVASYTPHSHSLPHQLYIHYYNV